MPRFFFHIDDDRAGTDVVGLDLPDLDEAKREAVRAAGEHLVDVSVHLWGGKQWTMRVKNEAGVEVLCLQFQASSAVI